MTRSRVTLAYMVRVVTPGMFTMPGVVAEHMYAGSGPHVRAYGSSQTIQVAKRN
jgi:uncharacterized protein YfaS (alpha-2-macroglobulin family)